MQSFSTTLFADADSEYFASKYVIFGVPFDGTTSYKPGCRDAPLSIRQASYNLESYLPHYDLEMYDVAIHDMGDLYVECLPDKMVDQVSDIITDLKKDGKIPVMIGGEHSVTMGAVKILNPKWYVVCDAHLDSQDEYRGSKFNHDCVTARISENVKNIIIIGARSGSKEEFEYVRKNYHLYTADDVQEKGINSILEEIQKMIGDDDLYLSIDADGIDCCYTPGLGTPEPFGLTPMDVRNIIRKLSPQAIGFDYVEVLPNDNGQTSMTAAHLIREFIASNYSNSKDKN